MKREIVLPDGVESVLLTREAIEERVADLAAAIEKDYANRDLLVLGALKGCVIFLADLIRCVDLPLQMDFLSISTYLGRTRSTVKPYVPDEQWPEVAGHHVLFVEDILDSGRTMAYAAEECIKRGAATFSTCTLLAKEGYENCEYPNPDYVGFVIPNVFVVGYGLDFDQRYRNLGCVGVLNEEVVNQDRGR